MRLIEMGNKRLRTRIFLIFCLAAVPLLLIHQGCGNLSLRGDPIAAKTKLISESLTSLTVGPNGLRIRPPHYAISTDCAGTGRTCITPIAVTGMAYYAGLMVGSGEQGGYSVGPIIGEVIDPSQAESYTTSELIQFDMADQLQIDGSPTCCGGSPYPEDDRAILSYVHIYFGYLDNTIEFTSSDGVATALVGKHIIRTIYADITDTEFKKGDLLYKGPNDSEFLWCTSSDGCTLSTRPSNPIQYAEVADYTNTGQGSKNIPEFAIQLTAGHTDIKLTSTDLLDKTITWTFTVDFDITNGVQFASNPTTLTKVTELVSAFRLVASPQGRNGSDADAQFKATVTAESSKN